ncbi:hypothetical protein GCM10011497_06750 [Elstera cyanobacteriorum]|uniref:Uncharacterized protein n=1 Tax=Elstera cyanobacteriorum TaxID=2022747 RepID=A0A255XTG6_9PROT|nr:hypothetical protein [Elstera cyanobacteriorum]OYQ20213.1 hypothetical protein CHR90_05760 [Elstera cyanobacteriorum]GFZ80853.1 hypothetical protein GCM10011497_06750 [Elstera cyanobacteriorum]
MLPPDLQQIADICALGALEHRLILTLAPRGSVAEHRALVTTLQDLVDQGFLIDLGVDAAGHWLKTADAVFAGALGRVAA